MKAFVHIGMPKTGTTTIQSWLEVNEKRLRKQNFGYDSTQIQIAITICEHFGRFFPNRRARAEFGILTPADQAKFARKYRIDFERNLSKQRLPAFIISSEYLGANLNSDGAVEAARDWLGQFFDSTDILLYFRRQEDLVPSSYTQRLRSGGRTSLSDVADLVCKNAYSEIAARWQKQFGDHLRVQLLEKDALVSGNLLLDFASALGVEVGEFSEQESLNTSFSAPALELLRAFNNLNPAFTDKGQRNPEARAFARRLKQIDDAMDAPRLKLTDKQTADVRARCAANNELLRSQYFPQRSELFPVRQSSDPLETAELPRLVAEMAIKVMAESNNPKGK